MTIFVDTSAVIPVLDVTQLHSKAASVTWRRLVANGDQLVTTNYVALEALSLVQNRLGINAARDVADAILPLIEIVWIDEDIHDRAVAALFTAGKRNLSLVDCTSFEVMRLRGLRTAFTLDRHFVQQGFERIP